MWARAIKQPPVPPALALAVFFKPTTIKARVIFYACCLNQSVKWALPPVQGKCVQPWMSARHPCLRFWAFTKKPFVFVMQCRRTESLLLCKDREDLGSLVDAAWWAYNLVWVRKCLASWGAAVAVTQGLPCS